MKNFFHKLLAHRIITAVFGASFVLVFGGWLWAVLALRHISQPLILHFNSYVGINQIGDIRDLTAVGFIGVLAVIMNFFIGLELDARDRLWGKMLAAATFFLAALIFIGFAAIINVN